MSYSNFFNGVLLGYAFCFTPCQSAEKQSENPVPIKKKENKKKSAKQAPEAFQLNCAACHISDRVSVGPSFTHIQEFYPKQKRKEFIEWCYNPGKRNPDMVQMPSMAHVKKEDLAIIHDYILSVKVRNPQPLSNVDDYPNKKRPRVIRTFLPKSGPASVLVALPLKKKLNLVWDTTQCRLRYISAGEADNYPYLKANGNALAEVGKIIYTEKSLFKSEKPPTYHGYKMKYGLPTFLYTVEGVRIEESITVADEALVRKILSKSTMPTLNHIAEDSTLTTKLSREGDKIIIIKHHF